MAGFYNGLLRKRAKDSRIVYISWLNKISSKGQIGSTCMGPLASQITVAMISTKFIRFSFDKLARTQKIARSFLLLVF